MIIIDTETIQLLNFYNPWWAKGKVPYEYLGVVIREKEIEILDSLDSTKITILTGGRQVGKSTIVYKIIDHLISKKIDSRQIIYLSMDSIKLRDSSIFLNIITYLQELLSQQNRFKDKIYFFIDEI
ncbi:MAG: AAA family ATPase, partial [archaeon]